MQELRLTECKWEICNAVRNLLDIANYSSNELEFAIQVLTELDLDWVECDEQNVKAMTQAHKALLKYFKKTLKSYGK